MPGRRKGGESGVRGRSPRGQMDFCSFLGLAGTWGRRFWTQHNEMYRWGERGSNPFIFG